MPALEPGDEFYLRAFWDLNTTRQIGMDLGPIPWNRIVEYGERAGLDHDLINPFVRIIRLMDAAYREWNEAEADKRRKQLEAQSPHARRPRR